jgi:hypothetical protein
MDLLNYCLLQWKYLKLLLLFLFMEMSSLHHTHVSCLNWDMIKVLITSF